MPIATKEIRSSATEPNRLVRIAMVLFLFSVPFETVYLGFNNEYLSLAKIVGVVLLVAALGQRRVCFRRVPRPFWCFVCYLAVLLIRGATGDDAVFPVVLVRFGQQVQLVTLFLIFYNIFTHDRTAKTALLTLSVACVGIAALGFLGVAATIDDTSLGIRQSAFEHNDNAYAAMLAFGALATVSLVYGSKSRIEYKIAGWLGFAVLVRAIAMTGSRGGAVALMVGVVTFLLHGRSAIAKLKVGAVVVLAGGGFIYASYSFETSRQRWAMTINERRMAQRERIYPTALEMFSEKPVAGWGPETHLYELGGRLDYYYLDTHNLFLWIITETGMLGAVPFFLGLWLCFRPAWRGRNGPHGILPLAMLSCLFIINLSSTFHNRKLNWIVLAYGVAASVYTPSTGWVVVRRPQCHELHRPEYHQV